MSVDANKLELTASTPEGCLVQLGGDRRVGEI